MTTVPLGKGAYQRSYSDTVTVELLNRWLEANPANLREGTAVLARPVTKQVGPAFDQGSFSGVGSSRGQWSLSGLFNNALFAVFGTNLYMLEDNGDGTVTVTAIEGTINGTGNPEVAWQAGLGYQRFWISDGLLLQFYSGISSATGTLTKTGTIVNGTDKFEVGGVFYVWGNTFSPSDAGTSANPFVVHPLNASSALDPINQLVLAITGTGDAGVDYSATIAGPNTAVTASGDGNIPAVSAKLTANTAGTSGNSITFTVVAGTALTASGSGTLASGGIQALQGCTMPGGAIPNSLTQVSSYVLVSVADSQEFFWVMPGETTIDPLDFASKESSPDPIISMREVGDQVLIMGERSMENWYATGNFAAPFAPIEGRVYYRGVVSGTPVVVDDGIILVGDDGRVYSIGFQPGDATDTSWGVNRISNNGIEERVRYQLRREDGLTP